MPDADVREADEAGLEPVFEDTGTLIGKAEVARLDPRDGPRYASLLGNRAHRLLAQLAREGWSFGDREAILLAATFSLSVAVAAGARARQGKP